VTEELGDVRDPVLWRLQQAFWREEPTTDLAAVVRRAGTARTLTEDEVAAARRREPAAVARVYTAYAPELFRMFMEAVGDRRQAEDLTGATLVSAIESLPRFRGPVEALGGWLFEIARHDLLDFRRGHARSPLAPIDEPEMALAPVRVLAELFVGLRAGGGLGGHAPLNRLSPREREVLRLVAEGRTNQEISRELLVSPHTVRVHLENILEKLQMHSRLEAVRLAIDHGWLDDAGEDPADRWAERLDDRQVLAAVRELPPDQRDVLVLRMLGGLTAPEVAEILGRTTGAVKAAQHRGLANLARVLGLREPRQHSDPSVSRGGGPTGAGNG
jgi:DNA-directed RNA polymerase specialized sigma24 family protein